MLRTDISDAYKTAMRAKDARAVATLRLIQAALKDRDIAARAKGNCDGVDEDEIREMLVKMVRQRREAIDLYEKGGRLELAEQESQEIEIIQRFLPQPLSEAETRSAVDAAIADSGANGLKDMGKCMNLLKERHAGVLDFGKVGAMVKARLSP